MIKEKIRLLYLASEGKELQAHFPNGSDWIDFKLENLSYMGNIFCENVKLRIKPEVKYREYRLSEAHLLIGRPIININDGCSFYVDSIEIGHKGIVLYDQTRKFRCQPFLNYTFPDGTPVGIKINE